jgi:hypothetical protein
MKDLEGVSIKKISPERGKYISPGQRPGDNIAVIFEALKGRNMIIGMHINIMPFQGIELMLSIVADYNSIKNKILYHKYQ